VSSRELEGKGHCDRSRRALFATLLSIAAIPASAHTPYKQWAVYRQKHLLIGCHKDLPETYDLAKQIVARLDADLPAARARIARAPATSRLASLLSTDQLDVAVLSPRTALDMASGEGVFAAYGEIPLTTLFSFEQLVLVGHARIRDHHSWQITKALETLPGSNVTLSSPVLPWHIGSRDYLDGKPMPVHD